MNIVDLDVVILSFPPKFREIDETRRACNNLPLPLFLLSRSLQTFDIERDQALTFPALAHT